MVKKVNSAVILAAGMGTRLKNITNGTIPKGFLKLNNISLIERSINKLRECGIEKTYIVAGHLSEYYFELARKNDDIEVLENKDYANTGSMASLAVLKNIIKDDFLLLESDLIYEKRAIIEVINSEKDSCMLISGMTNSGDEYYIEVKNDNLYKGSKNKELLTTVYGELVGINKISQELFHIMVDELKKIDTKQYHYEDAMIASSNRIKVGYKKIESLIWAEIDDSYHLDRVEKLIIPRLMEIGEE